MVVAGCVLLEYGVSTAAVTVGWSGYLNKLLNNVLGFQFPDALSYAPIPHEGDTSSLINLPIVIAGSAGGYLKQGVSVNLDTKTLGLRRALGLTVTEAQGLIPALPARHAVVAFDQHDLVRIFGAALHGEIAQGRLGPVAFRAPLGGKLIGPSHLPAAGICAGRPAHRVTFIVLPSSDAASMASSSRVSRTAVSKSGTVRVLLRISCSRCA